MAFKFGVIGAGGIAYRRTIPQVVAELKDIEISAVMDINEEAAKNVSREFGIRWYATEDDLLADKSINAVYIATPQSMHVTSVIRAADAKKHIFVEKPMGTALQDDLAMIEACKKNNVKLGVAYMMRYNACNKKAHELIKNGDLGIPVMGRAQLTCWYPKMPGVWRQNYDIAKGGSLMDMGGHCIDLLTMMFGKVAEVVGFKGNIVHDYAPVEDTSTVLLRFENGAHGIVDNYFNIPDDASKNRLELYGSKGAIVGEGCIGQDAAGKLEINIQKGDTGYTANQVRTEQSNWTVFEEKQTLGLYAQEIEDFALAVMNGQNPPIDMDHGLMNDKVMLAIYESMNTGRTVKII